MAYNIVYAGSTVKDLKKIDRLQAKKIIEKVESVLRGNPKDQPNLAGKSFKNLRKLRVGDYRVLFSITKNNVIISKIGHRRDVYQR